MVLGIISIALCWCYGLFGLASGIVALILAQKANAVYEENPDAYTLASYNNLKAGKICAIIGTILSGLVVAYVIIVFLIYGAALSYIFSEMPWNSF